MKRLLFQAIVLIGATLTSACAPSMSDLISQNHFREATCAAAESPDRNDAASTAMTRALDPQLHIEVISDDAVATAFRAGRDESPPAPGAPPGPSAPSGALMRSYFVRVRVLTNEIPIDHVAVALNAVGDVPAYPITLPTLAELTGEHAPPSHSATETHEILNAVSGAVSIFSLGMLDLGQHGPTTYEVPATTYEWQQAAPNAMRLFRAFGAAGCREQRGGPEDLQHVGVSCDAAFLVERGGSGSLAVDLDIVYGADRFGRNPELRPGGDEEASRCRVKAREHVALGLVATLPQTTAATFGPKFRAVGELATATRKE